jgi:predicted N-acyltransferase
MRQKIISLSLDTYELASKKANFSAWVRRKLLEEQGFKNISDQRSHYCSECGSEYPNYKEMLLCRCRWTAKTEVKQ